MQERTRSQLPAATETSPRLSRRLNPAQMSFCSSLKVSGGSKGLTDKTSPSPLLRFVPLCLSREGAWGRGCVPSVGHGTRCRAVPPRGCSLELVQAETLPQAAVSSTFCSEILTHPNLKVRTKLTAAGGGDLKHRNLREACTHTREQKAAGRLQRADTGSLPATSDCQSPLFPSFASCGCCSPF